MQLEQLIVLTALAIVVLTFAFITFIGFISIKTFIAQAFGKIRRSENEAYTALLRVHESKYHKDMMYPSNEHIDESINKNQKATLRLKGA